MQPCASSRVKLGSLAYVHAVLTPLLSYCNPHQREAAPLGVGPGPAALLCRGTDRGSGGLARWRAPGWRRRLGRHLPLGDAIRPPAAQLARALQGARPARACQHQFTAPFGHSVLSQCYVCMPVVDLPLSRRRSLRWRLRRAAACWSARAATPSQPCGSCWTSWIRRPPRRPRRRSSPGASHGLLAAFLLLSNAYCFHQSAMKVYA